MRHTTYILIGATALLLAGCPQTHTRDDVLPDSNSGGDESLSSARGVFDDTVTDSLDASAGDNTDCKYIDVHARGTFDLRVRFHESGISGTVSLLNEYGELLREVAFADGGEVRFSSFDAFPGRYYVRLNATEGASDYSIGQDFHTDPMWLSSEDAQWIDEQLAQAMTLAAEGQHSEALAGLEQVRSRFQANSEVQGRVDAARIEVDRVAALVLLTSTDDDDDDRGDDDDDSRDDDDSSDDDGDDRRDDGDDSGGASDDDTGDTDHGLQARIITLRDRGAGLGTVLVLTGCGTSSGLGIGSEGRIEGTRFSATITQITGADACFAESDRSRGEVGSASHVVF